MGKIVGGKYDPVCVSLSYRKKIELRIGEESGDKGSRYTLMSPKEARKVAIALLTIAEQAEE